MLTLAATNQKRYTFKGISLVHEVHDGRDKFKHRLTCLDYPPGEWVSYEWHATLVIAGRKFMACQDNWTPMFPSVFEVVEGHANV